MMPPQSASVGDRIADSNCGVTLDAQQRCCGLRTVGVRAARRGRSAALSLIVPIGATLGAIGALLIYGSFVYGDERVARGT